MADEVDGRTRGGAWAGAFARPREPSRPTTVAALKRGVERVDAARERAALSATLASAVRVCPAPARGASRVRSERERASAVRGLAAAVAHGAERGVVLAVHAALVSVRRGRATLYVGVAPDARFDAPEGACASWALGCVLYALITGEPLVPPRANTEQARVARGDAVRRRADALRVRGARAARRAQRAPARACELYVLASTLAYEPARWMRCTARGLVSALAPVYEQAEAAGPLGR